MLCVCCVYVVCLQRASVVCVVCVGSVVSVCLLCVCCALLNTFAAGFVVRVDCV